MSLSIRLFVLLAASAALAGCQREPRAPASAALPAVRVSTALVERTSLPVQLELPGTLRAVQRAAIAARLSGTIVTLSARLGDSVRAGDVLLTLATPELSARAAQARAQLAQFDRELARERSLLATGAGTKDAVKLLEDRIAQAQAAVREAETMLDYATVRAPFDGVIARRHVEVGDFAATGAPLLQLDGIAALEIDFGVPDSLAPACSLGNTLEVEMPAAALRFRATVTELSSASEAATRSRTARLSVPPAAALRPGQFVRVFVPGPATATVLVPASAVTAFGQMERVFTVDARGRASLRLVKTGATHGDRVAIVAGLEAGERIVLAPPATLRDGQPLDLAP